MIFWEKISTWNILTQYLTLWDKEPLWRFCQLLSVGFGEGNGSPLQYSCLENPMDRGARWAAVPGVAQSWTQLKRLSSSSSSKSWIGQKVGSGFPWYLMEKLVPTFWPTQCIRSDYAFRKWLPGGLLDPMASIWNGYEPELKKKKKNIWGLLVSMIAQILHTKALVRSRHFPMDTLL